MRTPAAEKLGDVRRLHQGDGRVERAGTVTVTGPSTGGPVGGVPVAVPVLVTLPGVHVGLGGGVGGGAGLDGGRAQRGDAGQLIADRPGMGSVTLTG